MTGSGVESVRAVLFDRDGTLVHDVPYNGGVVPGIGVCSGHRGLQLEPG